jgi:Protein of unknown function (DUF559)
MGPNEHGRPKVAGHRRESVDRSAVVNREASGRGCFADKLIVEPDGPRHLEPEAVEHDKQRTAWLAARGFHILRFWNQELDENIRAVVDTMERAIDVLEAAPRVATRAERPTARSRPKRPVPPAQS